MTVKEYALKYLDPEVAEILANDYSIITNPENLSEDFKNELGMRIPVIYNETVYNMGMVFRSFGDPETARKAFENAAKLKGIGLDLDNHVFSVLTFN